VDDLAKYASKQRHASIDLTKKGISKYSHTDNDFKYENTLSLPQIKKADNLNESLSDTKQLKQ